MSEKCKSCGAICKDTPSVARHIVNADKGSHTPFAVEWAGRYLSRLGPAADPAVVKKKTIGGIMAWEMNVVIARFTKKIGKDVFLCHQDAITRELMEL